MRLILASASPRRRELLSTAGIECDVYPAHINEHRLDGEEASAFALRLAREKAEAVFARHPQARVLGADTVVVVDEDPLGKPLNEADAKVMLRRLSGRAHEVVTGVALVCPAGLQTRIARTTVWMRDLTAREIDDYVASGEPADKAGAYAIQGRAARFIYRIDGEYSNVVGLPLSVVEALLSESRV